MALNGIGTLLSQLAPTVPSKPTVGQREVEPVASVEFAWRHVPRALSRWAAQRPRRGGTTTLQPVAGEVATPLGQCSLIDRQVAPDR